MAETICEAYIWRNSKSAVLYPQFREVFPTGVGYDMCMTEAMKAMLA